MDSTTTASTGLDSGRSRRRRRGRARRAGAHRGLDGRRGRHRPDLVDAIGDDLLRLEKDLGIVPADNLFEGRRTRPGSTTCSSTGLSTSGSRSTRTSSRSSSRSSTPGCSSRRCRRSPSAPTSTPSPSTPTTSSSRCPSRTRRSSATPCGPSPTSPRKTAPPGSVPGPTSPTTPPTSSSTTTRFRPTCRKVGVLVWVGSLWHGGGANTTATTARGHRHELLRRVHAPAGEPAARHPARHVPAGSPAGSRSCAAISIYNGLIGHIDKQHPGKLLLGTEQDTSLWCGTTPSARR